MMLKPRTILLTVLAALIYNILIIYWKNILSTFL